MKALAIGEIAQGVLLGIYSTEAQRSKAMDILLALRNYYINGIEPDTDGSLIHADTWEILKKEADSIIQADDEYHTKQRNAARARWDKQKASQCTAMHRNAPHKNTMRRNPLEKDKDKEKEIISKEKEKEKETSIGNIGNLIINKEIVEKLPGIENFKDPVDFALLITNQTSTLARCTYGSLLKTIGHEKFLDVCRTFQSEIKAGEVPQNLGATLTKKLQAKL